MTEEHIGICKHCGKHTEYKYKCKIRDYCSHACSNTAKWEKRTRAETKSYKCMKCEKPFTLLAYQASHREKSGKTIKYCSVDCGKLARVKIGTFQDTTCACCGVAIKKRHNQIRERNYCSRTCSSTSQRTDGSAWSNYNHDRDSRREYMRAYLENNRDRKNALSRQWAKENVEYRRYMNTLRRASGRITFEEWRNVVDAAQGKCQVCGETENLHVDHIVPVARGGKTEPGNLQLLCRFCNISKGAKPFTEWLVQRMKELQHAS